MARRKQVASDAPADEQEAIALVGEYTAGDREILRLKLTAADAIAALQVECAKAIEKIETEQKARFAALKSWWEVSGSKAVKGPRRSAEIAGAILGIRLSPPKLKLPKGIKDAAMVAALMAMRWNRKKEFLRAKLALDKPAILKALQGDGTDKARQQLEKQGLTVVQNDEFFIETGLDEETIRKEITASA